MQRSETIVTRSHMLLDDIDIIRNDSQAVEEALITFKWQNMGI